MLGATRMLRPVLASLLLVACSGSIGSGGNGGNGGSAGAGGSPPACDPPADAPAFGVGTGEVCYEPVTAGSVVPLMNGPQGGYHVWVGIGCAGDCGGATILRYGIQDQTTGTYVIPGDGELIGAAALVDVGGWREIAGRQAYMPGISWDPTTDPPIPEGSLLRLHAEALDDALNVLDQASVDFVLGEIVYWDPCSGDPNDPNCQFG
jgi:hypothetical protein